MANEFSFNAETTDNNTHESGHAENGDNSTNEFPLESDNLAGTDERDADIETGEVSALESDSVAEASATNGHIEVGDSNADGGDIDSILNNFQESSWGEMSLDEQKQSMSSLADYVAETTGNKNPPEIVFRDDMNDGEYGGYDPKTNTMEINEAMLGDSSEAVDTVAHEMWHAYQQQCAADPTSEKGQAYQEGFDNYISPEYDFEGYQNQMVEAEARDFAQGFKDRLAGAK